jgi:ferredoxin-NADP reductase
VVISEAKVEPSANSKYLAAKVLGGRRLTARISEFLIGAEDGSPLAPGEAGSHIELRFGGPSSRFLRHYSLVGPLAPGHAPEPFWRIAVQREDRSRGSAFIHATFREGTRLQVSHPIGTFRLAHDAPHVLLIAGGVGITPILPMLRSLSLRRRPFEILYAGTERSEMAYADEIEAIGGPNVHLHQAKLSGNANLLALLHRQPKGTIAYICGPGPMIDALTMVGADIGWPRDHIRNEVFNVAHRPTDTGLTVELRDRRRVEVGAGTTILDALEGAQIDTLSDCRRGECGLCVTDVMPGPAIIDHRDSFLTDAERIEGRKICICCSRVTNGETLKLDMA